MQPYWPAVVSLRDRPCARPAREQRYRRRRDTSCRYYSAMYGLVNVTSMLPNENVEL